MKFTKREEDPIIKGTLLVVVGVIVLWLVAVVGIAAVVIHFVSKFW